MQSVAISMCGMYSSNTVCTTKGYLEYSGCRHAWPYAIPASPEVSGAWMKIVQMMLTAVTQNPDHAALTGFREECRVACPSPSDAGPISVCMFVRGRGSERASRVRE